MSENKYLNIVQHYEACLDKYGDSHLGVDWPKLDDVEKRYAVMLDIMRFVKKDQEVFSLLDFGCGAAHLYEYMLKNGGAEHIKYAGCDLSTKFVELCQSKFPQLDFYQGDVLQNKDMFPNYDLVVMNGVFTEKVNLSYEEMFEYFKELFLTMYEKANVGVAFNVMSKHVAWERDDLFHLSFHDLGDFLTKEVTRNFIIRNDYGLYEYTTYVFK